MKLRPVLDPHDSCLEHWSSLGCFGCVYDEPRMAWVSGRFWYRVRQPFRALYYRLFVRFEYATVTAVRADRRRYFGADRFSDLEHEIARARTKFPGNQLLTVALTEEVGELAQAYLQGRDEHARTEALQVACVAMRIVEEGDATFEPSPAAVAS